MARCGDDVAFGLENRGVPTDMIWPRVHSALRRVGFPYHQDRATAALSGGEQQRLALAGALALRPGLLLLDEPTASLDPDTGDAVRSWLERYRAQSGCTILLASHNMAEVERLCSHVLVMKTGRIVDQGSPADLLARYGRDDLEEVFLDIARGRERAGAVA
jgi:ABC-2 type transport system ATP-binding protein